MSLERGIPPRPASARSFSFEQPEVHALETGLRLYLARRTTTPLVDIQILFPAGAQFAPADRPGLATFTGSLLDQGTARRSASELAVAIENLGGYSSTGAGWNHAFAAVGVLAKDLAEGTDVLSEIACTPSFPEVEVERLRKRRLAELRQRKDDPAALAGDTFSRALYGRGVYGHPLAGSGTSLAAVRSEDCSDFYRRRFTAAGTFAVVVGDFGSDRVLALLEEGLAGLPTGPVATPAEFGERRPDGIEVHLVDRPQGSQTELRLGHVAPVLAPLERVPLRVLNSILGGKFTSRINLNLRERHGYTYGAHSRFVERHGPAPFLVSTAVANDVAGAAAREVLGELRRIREAAVDVDELEDAKSYLLGVFPYTLQTLHGLSTRLQEIASYELPPDHFVTYPQTIAAITKQELLDAARRYLQPENLVVVAVGPAEVLEPQLADLGRVRRWSLSDLYDE